MKPMNIHKTKLNENEAWFKSPFIPSSQEMDWAYSTDPGTYTGPVLHDIKQKIQKLNTILNHRLCQ